MLTKPMYTMLKTYNELSDDHKEIARELYPIAFKSYCYRTQGVEIAYSAR